MTAVRLFDTASDESAVMLIVLSIINTGVFYTFSGLQA